MKKSNDEICKHCGWSRSNHDTTGRIGYIFTPSKRQRKPGRKCSQLNCGKFEPESIQSSQKISSK
jgi:hypothetical protein